MFTFRQEMKFCCERQQQSQVASALLLLFVVSACAAHCSRCDAPDRGAAKCNDDGCDGGFNIDKTTLTCVPGEFLELVNHHLPYCTFLLYNFKQVIWCQYRIFVVLV